LGILFTQGQGVPKDDAAAAKYFRIAAEQGYPPAQLDLAVTYQNGNGVPQDFSECYFWLKVASTGKIDGVTQEDMRTMLSTTAGHLTPAALSSVQQRARKWLAEHPQSSE